MTRPSLPTLARTLWYWRREQWLAAARQRFVPVERAPRRTGGTPHLVSRESRVPWLPPSRALERVPSVAPATPGDPTLRRRFAWNERASGRLALEQLHAFDWLRAPGLAADERLRTIVDWISFHPRGVGWEAAPTRRRTVAWLKCLTTPGALPPAPETHGRLLPSLADQVAWLECRLAREPVGDGLLGNLLALAMASTLLEGADARRWRRHLPRLARELVGQIGPDGAHESRSPMLHAKRLEGVLDLLNALRSAPGNAPAELDALLVAKAGAMLAAHAVWTHPDGEIALLGDSTLGAAPPLAPLVSYAEALGVKAHSSAAPGVLEASGVVRLEREPFVAIFSSAPPAPAWYPAHAHCDALAFELSMFGERLVSDSGAADLVDGPWRDLARATRSHATVVVNGAEQAELWGADCVGGRPDAGLVRSEPGVGVEGVCAGWSTPEVLHRRRLVLDGASLRIEDRFDLPAAAAQLLLPLAPGVGVRVEGSRASLSTPGGRRIALTLPTSTRWRVVRAPCFVEPGSAVERSVLVGEASALAAADWCFTPEP